MLAAFFIKLFTFYTPFHEVERKAKIRNRYNQVTHLTPNTKCESEKKHTQKTTKTHRYWFT